MTPSSPSLLIDSDVLIDYLRNIPEAVTYIDTLTNPLFLSAINSAELYAGVRDGAERIRLERFLQAFIILPVDPVIAVTGGLFRRDYGKTYGTGLADALIAATVHVHQLRFVTLNKKHFPMLSDIIVPY
jgi:predicted nucleic acid-binding protein